MRSGLVRETWEARQVWIHVAAMAIGADQAGSFDVRYVMSAINWQHKLVRQKAVEVLA
jgi:hypothetical protein